MSLQALAEQLRQVFSTLLYGLMFAGWGALCPWLGDMRGYRRGVNKAPQVREHRWQEEHFKRLVAEDRADTAERVSKRFEVAMLEAVGARQERARLELVERREAR